MLSAPNAMRILSDNVVCSDLWCYDSESQNPNLDKHANNRGYNRWRRHRTRAGAASFFSQDS